MTLNPKHRSADDFASVIAQEAVLPSAHAEALRGKNIGLLCDAAGSPDEIALITRAVAALGAQVAHIGPGLPSTFARPRVQAAARLLGLLYDAVICIGIAPELVRRIGENAGIPVFDGIGTTEPAGVADAPRRGRLIQAALLDALS